MKKLTNIAGHPSIASYVRYKLGLYEAREKNFETLFDLMFSEEDNIMAELTDGYRIQKVTYGQFRSRILSAAPTVKQALGNVPYDSLVGIYMDNSMDWLVAFWSVLLCGCRPLLLNTRLEDSLIDGILKQHGVAAVISDGKTFCVPTLPAAEVLAPAGAPITPAVFGSEVIFMSSGTTEQVKLCAYNGENFYYQVRCTLDIVERCPDIARHYDGQLRQLMLLPLYHVFGFIAVYLWFGFFARTFVFLKDMNPATILNTVRKHRVTHIFAVPLVWDTIHREALRKIRSRGDKTYEKFCKGLSLCNRTGKLGDKLAQKLLGEVRDGIFGDSVQFMISGGSHISPETVSFFNGIGYPLVNGYGMTEVGITSVELSCRKSARNKAAIGTPFSGVEYRIEDDGSLLIRSKARAERILTGDRVALTAPASWFSTRDMACFDGKRYFLQGRSDDLIICENGENLNPVLAEQQLKSPLCREICLFQSRTDGPVLLASAPDCYRQEDLEQILGDLRQRLSCARLSTTVKKIAVTPRPLLGEKDFKLPRRSLAREYDSGKLPVLSPQRMAEYRKEAVTELERRVRSCFAQVLGKEESQIGTDEDFFADLGGSSLDFFALKDLLHSAFHINIAQGEQPLTTVRACVAAITRETGD